MMKKIRMILCTIAVLSLILAGCGDTGDANSGGDGGTDNKTGGAPALSEILYGNDASVWYVCRTIDKEEKPDVYVMYGDGTYIIESEYSFGELSKMTDEEIVTWAENKRDTDWEQKKELEILRNSVTKMADVVEAYSSEVESQNTCQSHFGKGGSCMSYLIRHTYEELQTYAHNGSIDNWGGFEQALDIALDNALERMDSTGGGSMVEQEEQDYHQELISPVKEFFMEKYDTARKEAEEEVGNEWPENSKPQYGLSIFTDSTGNNAQKEVIWLTKDDDLEIEYGSTPYFGEVYESSYIGYKAGGVLFGYRAVNSSVPYELDAIGTDGILIDETNESSGAFEVTP